MDTYSAMIGGYITLFILHMIALVLLRLDITAQRAHAEALMTGHKRYAAAVDLIQTDKILDTINDEVNQLQKQFGWAKGQINQLTQPKNEAFAFLPKKYRGAAEMLLAAQGGTPDPSKIMEIAQQLSPEQIEQLTGVIANGKASEEIHPGGEG